MEKLQPVIIVFVLGVIVGVIFTVKAYSIRRKWQKRKTQKRPAARQAVYDTFVVGDITLTVAPEGTLAGYTRAKFGPTLSAACGETETKRDQILLKYGMNISRVGTAIIKGNWICPYTGTTMRHPNEIEIDHLVPLAEAWRSGASKWNRAKRTQFARDVNNLVPVSKAINRVKSDSDIADWLPPKNQHEYIAAWIQIKGKYGLTIDSREHRLLKKILP